MICLGCRPIPLTHIHAHIQRQANAHTRTCTHTDTHTPSCVQREICRIAHLQQYYFILAHYLHTGCRENTPLYISVRRYCLYYRVENLMSLCELSPCFLYSEFYGLRMWELKSGLCSDVWVGLSNNTYDCLQICIGKNVHKPFTCACGVQYLSWGEFPSDRVDIVQFVCVLV